MAGTASIRVVPGGDVYAAAILEDVAERLREAAFYISAGLHEKLTALSDQAKSFAVAAKSVTGTQPDTETATERALRAAELEAVDPAAATADAARARLARLDQLFRVAARARRPCSFRVGQLLVDAVAVEAVLDGCHVRLHPQETVYLFARISVLGGVRAVEVRRIAAAVDTGPDAFERAYHQYWKAVAELRELAAGPLPATGRAPRATNPR